jgi:light-regulated signal transduction histidine kinase (bacteriophytochrome)
MKSDEQMPTPNSDSTDAAKHADRLLSAMHQVLSHDLPNQLVVIQALANLLDDEEKKNLTADGQEYLQRLVGAARQAGELTTFLQRSVRGYRAPEPVKPNLP